MSYIWENGEVITAEKLNNTGGSILIVDLSGSSLSDEDMQILGDIYARMQSGDKDAIVIGYFGKTSGANKYGKVISASVSMGGLTFIFGSIDIYGNTLQMNQKTVRGKSISSGQYRYTLTAS